MDNKMTLGIILVLIGLFSFIFLGFTGFRVIFGMLLVFFLPFYILLGRFGLSRGERMVFSLFIGIGVFPSIVYWLGVFMSFRLAIVVTFVVLMIVALFLKKSRD